MGLFHSSHFVPKRQGKHRCNKNINEGPSTGTPKWIGSWKPSLMFWLHLCLPCLLDTKWLLWGKKSPLRMNPSWIDPLTLQWCDWRLTSRASVTLLWTMWGLRKLSCSFSMRFLLVVIFSGWPINLPYCVRRDLDLLSTSDTARGYKQTAVVKFHIVEGENIWRQLWNGTSSSSSSLLDKLLRNNKEDMKHLMIIWLQFICISPQTRQDTAIKSEMDLDLLERWIVDLFANEGAAK